MFCIFPDWETLSESTRKLRLMDGATRATGAKADAVTVETITISALGCFFLYFCIYKTKKDMNNLIF